ncbi:hypothetical protein Lesp02_53230 [Lentzea sp. NBRC 105346]|uniref:DUF3592 domain-containing protein n=1 Tax=Lentzea sp. NBRC 105346 TaxID=3032205 RepID=UPI0024A39676|nr:DUF3592 domain-containing protein [Lentzea sp. NBRC 105346]GLZ33135.1 hypothetical protein Lesp02_53230 [Lentzea sp. NBRC 105346]
MPRRRFRRTLDPAALPVLVRRLRSAGVRSAVIGAVLLIGGGFGWYATDAAETELLRTGVRVPGHVKSVQSRSIVIGYFAGGDQREYRVQVPISHDYLPGDQVTVIYDPKDPAGRVRTTAEMNMNPGFVISAVGGVLGLIVGAGGVLGVVRWSRRLGVSEWRRGHAEVAPGSSRLRVRFPGHVEDFVLSRPYAGLRRSMPTVPTTVWVGGNGIAYTVAFVKYDDTTVLAAVKPFG